MELEVIGSGSRGNSYLLISQNEVLILEAGMSFFEIKKTLDFDLSKVVGCLVSHEHKDHSKCVAEMLNAGIPVYASAGTWEALDIANAFNSFVWKSGQIIRLGKFEIKSFSTRHDAAEPFGFLIRHPEAGTILFATDTYYLQQRFRGLNNILIECNYEAESLREKFERGEVAKPLYERLLTSHMSLKTCLKMLDIYDLSKVNKIVLVHLSDANSDACLFQNQVEYSTGKEVFIAEAGLKIDFNRTAF